MEVWDSLGSVISTRLQKNQNGAARVHHEFRNFGNESGQSKLALD
jgi:hypothetical protein